MNSKQARLVAAVSDAMNAQGFSQNGLSRAAGVTQSMISAALGGKYDLKEEKWRMICEVLAIDYDSIVADDPASPQEQEPTECEREVNTEDLPAPEGRLRAATECRDDPMASSLVRLDAHSCRVVAEYLASHLKDDVQKGTDMPLEDLYALLDITRTLGACADEP